MSQGKVLLNNTVIYAIGNFGSKILTFLLLPLYSFYLSTGEFGIYDIILTTLSFLVPIVTWQFSEASYRWLLDSEENDEKRSVAISNGLAVVLVSTVVFSLIYLILSFFFDFQLTNYFPFILVVSCFLPFFQQSARGLGKAKIYAYSGIISVVCLLGLNIWFLVFLNLKLESLLIALIVSKVAVIFFIVHRTRTLNFFSFDKINFIVIRKMFQYAWPLIPNTISWWLINAADKYIILYVLGTEANGIYAVSSRFPAIIVMFNSVFLLAWQDSALTSKEQDNSSKDSFFAKTFQKFINFELPLIAILICISQYLVIYFLDEKFHDAWKYIPLLFLGVAFSSFSAYIGAVYQRANKTKGIFTTTLIGGIVNILICISLINFIGLYAPAVGSFISFLLIYLIRKYETNSFSPIYVDNINLILLTLWVIICMIISSLENNYFNFVFLFISIGAFFKFNLPILLYVKNIIVRKNI